MTGIDISGRIIVLDDLQADLIAGGVSVPNGLTIAAPPGPMPTTPVLAPQPYPAGTMLFTYDDQHRPADLPPAAAAIVAAYTP